MRGDLKYRRKRRGTEIRPCQARRQGADERAGSVACVPHGACLARPLCAGEKRHVPQAAGRFPRGVFQRRERGKCPHRGGDDQQGHTPPRRNRERAHEKWGAASDSCPVADGRCAARRRGRRACGVLWHGGPECDGRCAQSAGRFAGRASHLAAGLERQVAAISSRDVSREREGAGAERAARPRVFDRELSRHDRHGEGKRQGACGKSRCARKRAAGDRTAHCGPWRQAGGALGSERPRGHRAAARGGEEPTCRR